MIYSNKKLKTGVLSVEILIASLVVSIAFIALILVASSTISLSRQTLHQTQVAFLLEEGTEAVKIIRNSGWQNISNKSFNTDYYLSFSGGNWSLDTSPVYVDDFLRKVSFFSVQRDAYDDIVQSGGVVDLDTRLVKVQVFWNEGSVLKSKSIDFYISNIFSS